MEPERGLCQVATWKWVRVLRPVQHERQLKRQDLCSLNHPVLPMPSIVWRHTDTM